MEGMGVDRGLTGEPEEGCWLQGVPWGFSEGHTLFPAVPRSPLPGAQAQVWVFPAFADRLAPPRAEGGRRLSSLPSLRPTE